MRSSLPTGNKVQHGLDGHLVNASSHVLRVFRSERQFTSFVFSCSHNLIARKYNHRMRAAASLSSPFTTLCDGQQHALHFNHPLTRLTGCFKLKNTLGDT